MVHFHNISISKTVFMVYQLFARGFYRHMMGIARRPT